MWGKVWVRVGLIMYGVYVWVRVGLIIDVGLGVG